MKLHTIDTGFFKLDGGAMFGVVPKSIWHKLNPADENNMCSWALRCLLVEHENRLVLIDNGIGNKQDEKFYSHYYLHGNDSLSASLKKKGFHESDITDVVLTHLHFDHCGGSIQWNNDRTKFEATFPNATYWSNEVHWNWATKPNAREKASFLKENILPIQESGHLKFVKEGENLFPGFSFIFSNGHTEGMMLPKIQNGSQTIVYCADLIPSSWHVPLPYIMAYDMKPYTTLLEKTKFLDDAAAGKWLLFFEHDPQTEVAALERTEKGVKISQRFNLSEV